MRRALAAALLLFPLAAHAQDCVPPLRPMLRAELYFGRTMGKGEMSEAQWRQFAAQVLTPGFPDGLTVLDARGQWRDGRRLVRERSKLVIVVLSDAPAAHERITAAAEAYKTRFHQKSVGIVVQPVCAAFD
jgi:hypothetical protein